jgi:hypothetical protein
VAQWKAQQAAKRPKTAKLVSNGRLREYVQDRLAGSVRRPDSTIVAGPKTPVWKGLNKPHRQDRRWATAWSPEQISHRLRVEFPDDESMRMSHEAIYQSLFIQGRGALKRELVACLRTGRALRVPRARSQNKPQGHVTADVVLPSVPPKPPTAATTIRQKLPGLLAELERLAIAELSSRGRPSPHLEVLASELGVVSAYQDGTDYPGSIYPTIAQPSQWTGGMVPETGDPLARWIGDWLREPRRADNLRKLTRSGLPERHAFVIVAGFATAPFPVVDLLMRPAAQAPTIPPDLPSEVTHVWTMSPCTSGDGMRRSPDLGWTNFVKIFTVDSAQ